MQKLISCCSRSIYKFQLQYKFCSGNLKFFGTISIAIQIVLQLNDEHNLIGLKLISERPNLVGKGVKQI